MKCEFVLSNLLFWLNIMYMFLAQRSVILTLLCWFGSLMAVSAGPEQKQRLPLLNATDPAWSCQLLLPLSFTQVSCSPWCLACTDTQVHSLSVCTEQLSGFLWSCHASLAQATAAEPRLTPAAPERRSSANVIGLLMRCFHCCWAFSSLCYRPGGFRQWSRLESFKI